MFRLGLIIAALCLFASPVLADTDYIASGYDYLREGDLERAERMFKGAIKLDINSEAAWKGLKQVHAAQEVAKKSGGMKDPATAMPPRKSPRSPQGPPSGPSFPPPPPADPAMEEINRELLSKYLPGAVRNRPKSSDDHRAEAAGKGSGERTDEPEEAPSRRNRSPSASRPAQGARVVKETLDDSINEELLKDEDDASEAFKKLRVWATTRWKRDHNGATEFLPSYYGPDLYKLLVTKLAAQKHWSVEQAKQRFRKLVKDQEGLLEFYVKMRNYTRSPKVAVAIHDIFDRTTLEDDHGNSYRPIRFKAPSVTKLLTEDSYTVWFPKYDSDGNSVVDKAKSKLFLIINDQEHEPATIRIPFEKKQFKGEAGEKGGESWWDKLF